MTYTHFGPFRVAPEMRRDIEILVRVRNMTMNDWATEAFSLLLARDKENYSTGYKVLIEAQRQIDEEVDRQGKAS